MIMMWQRVVVTAEAVGNACDKAGVAQCRCSNVVAAGAAVAAVGIDCSDGYGCHHCRGC